jgi:hypothetical protein
MNIFSNNLLSTVHHLSARLGPVMTLCDGLLEHITPKTTAQACSNNKCGGLYCGACCRNCGGDYESQTWQRYTALPNCNGANCWVYLGCTYC